jgi:hypothetical protein
VPYRNHALNHLKIAIPDGICVRKRTEAVDIGMSISPFEDENQGEGDQKKPRRVNFFHEQSIEKAACRD